MTPVRLIERAVIMLLREGFCGPTHLLSRTADGLHEILFSFIVFGMNAQLVFDKFNALNKDTLHLIDELYDDHCVFEDPLHRFDNREKLKKYFAYQYKNVISCRFEKKSEWISTDGITSEWIMYLRHRALNGGREIQVAGVSMFRISQNKKILWHRDYFDVSQMLMENIPVFGQASRLVRKLILATGPK